MRSGFAAGLRTLAVVGKELVQTIRRPWALASIVFGPFLILLVFGAGFMGQLPVKAAMVVPDGSGLPSDPATYQEAAGGAVQVVAVDLSEGTARDRLRAGEVEVVVIAPADGRQTLEAGAQVVIRVEYDSVDPYVSTLVGAASDRIASTVNRELTRRAAQEAADAAETNGTGLPPGFEPDLVAEPTRVEVTDIAPTAPNMTWFYGTAVLALIIQHVAVTLSALSMFRDRQRGLLELFRISPIRSGELLVGKYIAIALIAGLVAAAMIAMLVGLFALPTLGRPGTLGLAIGLLILAGTGLGLVVGLVSDSERQVVQLTLLVLLASVFFGGLAVNLSLMSVPVQAGAQLLPVTPATAIFQDLMLRGAERGPLRYFTLGAVAVVLFLSSAVLLRRTLAPRK